MAVIRVSRDGRKVRTKFLDGAERKFPSTINRLILTTADSRVIELNHLVYLDQLLGQFFAGSAARYIKRLESKGTRVDLIASHGQTVRHLPHLRKWKGFTLRGTLQLGSLEQIAARTGRVVVGDFRQADIALGNEGAPITTSAMNRLFSDRIESRLIVNIGGISNYFYLPAAKVKAPIRAADCGPGNSLSDLLSTRLFREKYDRSGRRASSGDVSRRLMHLLMSQPFFRGGSVSTGRESFGPDLAEKLIASGRKLRLANNDLLATAVELTARSIAHSLQPILKRDKTIRNLYLTGGGVNNSFMVRRISELLEALPVASIKKLGVNPNLVEASAYAVMGEACLRSESLPTRFDNRSRQKQPVLGRLVQPPGK
jgi:anhydro-N-acetylmuramic acid kinase